MVGVKAPIAKRCFVDRTLPEAELFDGIALTDFRDGRTAGNVGVLLVMMRLPAFTGLLVEAAEEFEFDCSRSGGFSGSVPNNCRSLSKRSAACRPALMLSSDTLRTDSEC